MHLLEWPEVGEWRDEALAAKWSGLRNLRALVTERIEPLRREKILGSSLEAEVTVPEITGDMGLAELFISAAVKRGEWAVVKSNHHKCGRCWRLLPEVTDDGDLCNRCEGVVNG